MEVKRGMTAQKTVTIAPRQHPQAEETPENKKVTGAKLLPPKKQRGCSLFFASSSTSVLDAKDNREYGMKDSDIVQKSLESTPEQIAANIKLARLQTIFRDANTDGEAGLSMDEFKDALRRTSNKPIDEEEIETLFMKMDANCDGTLDWEEYVSYNLLEYQERSQMLEMLKEKPFPKEIKCIHTRHHDNIVRVIYSPHVHKRWTSMDYTNGKYATLSKDGIVTFWSLGLRHNRFHTVSVPNDRATQPWFVDMVSVYNVNMLAVASTDRDISFYDMTAKKFVRRYVITGLENCVTSMDYWADLDGKTQSVMVWGDTAGNAYGIYFEIHRGSGLFGSLPTKQEVAKRISFAELLRGHFPNIKAFRLAGIHDDWVTKMAYIPELGCFLSCCQSSTTSLYLGDFLKKKSPSYFKVNKGLFAFDYCSKLNIIATGGMDYNVRIWNPYVNNKCILLLKGHTKPVVHVVLMGKKHQVLSIDKGKSIRVFDLKDQSCLQNLSGRIISLGPFPISTIIFNPDLQHLVLATNKLGLLESREEDERHVEILSHNKPVVQALFNRAFKVVVSACEESVVSVWDIETGEKSMQFVNAHTVTEDGIVTPLEITAMAFDPPERRLLTGARDGIVKVWNFNVGACLQSFYLSERAMVTGIICTARKFYITGWSRVVDVFVDGEGDDICKKWAKKHEEDILCMAHFHPTLLATGAYDGTINVWLRETGHVVCKLNAHGSDKAIPEGTYSYNENQETETPLYHSKSDSEYILDATDSFPGSVSPTLDFPAYTKSKAGSFYTAPGYHLKPKVEKSSSVQEQLDTDKDCEEELCNIINIDEKVYEHPLLGALHPQTPQPDKTPNKLYSRQDYDSLTKNYEASIESLVFLQKRNYMDKETAVLVSSGAEGWVRFWSVAREGGLLGQFNAAHEPGSSVNCMVTDADNNFLITADTMGVVKVWDIMNYCIRQRLPDMASYARFKKLIKRFPYLRIFAISTAMRQNKDDDFVKRPPPAASNPEKTLNEPLCLNSFRAHTKAINHMDFINDRQLIITSSADCAIRLWTVCGKYIGTFGERWKQLPKRIKAAAIQRTAPKDIRRCGSARTMRVLNGGKLPYWRKAINLVKQRGYERLKAQFEHLQDKDELNELLKKQELEQETSNILGKSYKRQVRHKMPPVLPKLFETPSTIAVYHSLPFAELTPMDITQANATLEEISQRRFLPNIRETQKKEKKSDTPLGFVGNYNQMVNKNMGLGKQIPQGRLRKVSSRHTKLPMKTPESERSTATSSPVHAIDAGSPVSGTGRNPTKLKFPVIE